MARTVAELPAGTRITDYISLGMIAKSFPREKIVLRSKTPDLVRQEFYGLLLAHYAIRGLMPEAALQADEDPYRLSFVHAVRVILRRLPRFATLPPWGQSRLP